MFQTSFLLIKPVLCVILPCFETDSSKSILKQYSGYDQFGVSRKGPQDTTDEHCTIFYDKEKVYGIILVLSHLIFYLTGLGTFVHNFFFFFEKMKVELLEGGTFWLSESPSVPGSISWGSEVPCIATWAISLL